jgi:hypothetical protein
VAVATATPAEIWLSCAHRYSATENDLVAFFDGFDVVRGSVRLVSPAWQCVRNGRYVFICIAVWVLCHLHAHCTACPNLIPRFGTTVDGRPSGEGWVSPLHPPFFPQQEPEFSNESFAPSTPLIFVSGWLLKSIRGPEGNEGQGQAAHRRPLRGNISPSGAPIRMHRWRRQPRRHAGYRLATRSLGRSLLAEAGAGAAAMVALSNTREVLGATA